MTFSNGKTLFIWLLSKFLIIQFVRWRITVRQIVRSGSVFVRYRKNNFQANVVGNKLPPRKQDRPPRPEARELSVREARVAEAEADRFRFGFQMGREHAERAAEKRVTEACWNSTYRFKFSLTIYRPKSPSSNTTKDATFGQRESFFTCL